MPAHLKKAYFKAVNVVVQLTEQPKSMLALKQIVNVAESHFFNQTEKLSLLCKGILKSISIC